MSSYEPSLGTWIGEAVPPQLENFWQHLNLNWADLLNSVRIKNLRLTNLPPDTTAGEVLLLFTKTFGFSIGDIELVLTGGGAAYPNGVRCGFVARLPWLRVAEEFLTPPITQEDKFYCCAVIAAASPLDLYTAACERMLLSPSSARLVAAINDFYQLAGTNQLVIISTGGLRSELAELIALIEQGGISLVNRDPRQVLFDAVIDNDNVLPGYGIRQRLEDIFSNWFKDGIERELIRFFVPDISVSLLLSAVVSFPRYLLKPVGPFGEATAEEKKFTLVVSPGEFTASTFGQFGFSDEITVQAGEFSNALLGDSGFILELANSDIKLDFSESTNIAEAIADGRPNSFQGMYISNVGVRLPPYFAIQGTPPILRCRNLLVGTYGVSGEFYVAAGTSSLAELETEAPAGNQQNPLVEAHLFNGNVALRFYSLKFALRQNALIQSAVNGIITIQGIYDPANPGQLLELEFELSFNGAGFVIAFESTALRQAKLGPFIGLGIQRLAIGKDGNHWFLEMKALVTIDSTIPIVGKVLPKEVNIRRLLLSTSPDRNDLDIGAKWENGVEVGNLAVDGISISRALNAEIIAKVARLDTMRLTIKPVGSTSAPREITALTTFDASLRLGGGTGLPPTRSDKDAPGFLAFIDDVGFLTRIEFRANNNGEGPGGNLGPLNIRLVA